MGAGTLSGIKVSVDALEFERLNVQQFGKTISFQAFNRLFSRSRVLSRLLQLGCSVTSKGKFHDRIAAPVMVLMMLLVRRKAVMGNLSVEGSLYWLGWLATAVMTLSIAGMAFSMAPGRI